MLPVFPSLFRAVPPPSESCQDLLLLRPAGGDSIIVNTGSRIRGGRLTKLPPIDRLLSWPDAAPRGAVMVIFRGDILGKISKISLSVVVRSAPPRTDQIKLQTKNLDICLTDKNGIFGH